MNKSNTTFSIFNHRSNDKQSTMSHRRPAMPCPKSVHIKKGQRKTKNKCSTAKFHATILPKTSWARHLDDVYIDQVVKVRFDIARQLLGEFDGTITNIFANGMLEIYFALTGRTETLVNDQFQVQIAGQFGGDALVQRW